MSNEYGERIAELDAKATDLRLNMRLTEMIRCMEDSLSLRVTAQGGEHPEAQAAAERLLKEYNTAAMQLLRGGNSGSARSILDKVLRNS